MFFNQFKKAKANQGKNKGNLGQLLMIKQTNKIVNLLPDRDCGSIYIKEVNWKSRKEHNIVKC